ncbi:DUF1028 domain-containing protein [Candidatus Poribacteria bacterium]|nr:DUF1028 domain-containing protein [Candidatus Poribacteria bacterium]MYF55414.1 DUF1028 domain-containing protein [Candidatus Poribacteria bacterium]
MDKPISTFSIVGYDPDNGDLGIAVQSKFFAVGAVVPWAEAGVGAIATQSWANTTYGPRGLELLKIGLSAKQTLDHLIKDDTGKNTRQVGIVDANGNVSNYTGEECHDWAGAISGEHFTAQGNILTGEEVVKAMGATFENSKGELADRLLDALIAGQEKGGDKRGQQSAALYVVRKNGGYSGFNDRYVDLRVDDHEKPIAELKRLLDIHKKFFPRQ